MVNKVILVGNVGADPEIKTLPSGTKIANLRLATSEKYKNDRGEMQTITEWHTIVLFDRLADVADKYIRKGTQIYVEGKIRTREYTPKDNVTRRITEIIGNAMYLLGNKPTATQTADAPALQESAPAPAPAPIPKEVDDLPF